MTDTPAPRLLVEGFSLELIASAPDIVTPIAIAFDHQGQLLVIESHTHQRPEGYSGPESDRIQRLVDRDHDGRIEHVETFLDGLQQAMSLVRGPDEWIYGATRREVFRVRDADGDGRAEVFEALVRLDTHDNYPHNGLAGLTFASDGRLCFGLGENTGAAYRLLGSDGRVLTGEGEGGSVYACQADGSGLVRLATGFWNPFGSCFDPYGRLFTVDNDPDSSPPCRLLHVVPHGDYGYQFRFGRSGRHPLQAWDAELPGTLPMAAGTGEAPCQIVPYRGQLWVTSWGDFRLERYTLLPVGATCQARAEIVVQGDARFRPVGLAIAADGSLYFSDWVDHSYPVHRQGRVWRLVPDSAAAVGEFPPLSAAEQRAAELRASRDRQVLLDAMLDDDPFVLQAAGAGLADCHELVEIDWTTLASPRQRLGVFQALSWQDPHVALQQADKALHDPDPQICLQALRLIAEHRAGNFRAQVVKLLSERQPLSTQLGAAALATLAWLDQGQEAKDLKALHALLAEQLSNPRGPAALRRLALRSLPADHAACSIDRMAELLDQDKDQVLSTAIIDSLAERGEREAGELLATLARSRDLPSSLRADACAALAAYPSDQKETIVELQTDDDPEVRREAERNLRPRHGGAANSPLTVDRLESELSTKPGDPAAGRRVFFRAVGGRCGACHAHQGHGGRIGPELTTIRRRADRHWLLETILDPNRDVAPRFATVTIITTDGRSITGQPLPGPGDDAAEGFVLADGSTVTVPLAEIEARHYSNQSLMPQGLGQVLGRDELRDLIAFLIAE